MKNYTDCLIESVILEAGSLLTDQEKMKLFDNGLRRENVKACSDDKLRNYRAVCVLNGYNKALAQIEQEMKNRGILPGQNQTAKTTTQPVNTSQNTTGMIIVDPDKWLANYLIVSLPTQTTFELLCKLAKTSVAEFKQNILVGSRSAQDIPVLIQFWFENHILALDSFNIPEKHIAQKDIAKVLEDELKAAGVTKYILQAVHAEMQKQGLDRYLTMAANARQREFGLTEGLEVKSLQETVEKHDTLNPKLWNEDNTLKQEVKDKILQIIQEFTDNLAEDEIKIDVDDIILIGSNCSYNYNAGSDLDIHIKANTATLDCPEKHLAKLYSAYRSLFNKKLDIDFYGIPVELYVETEDSNTISNGIYSVLNDTWIKEPVQADIPEINDAEIQKEVGEWTVKYNKILAQNSIDAIDDFIEQVYNLRKQAMEAGEEYNTTNLVFKELRNAGYLDNLKDLKAKLKSRELSLESLNEDLIVYETADDLETVFKAFQECEDPTQKEELKKAVNTALFQTHDGAGVSQDRWQEIYNIVHGDETESNLTGGVAEAKSIVADQIRGEWEAIQNYNKAIDDLESTDLTEFTNVIDLLNDIASEEEVHCGELEIALNIIDSDTTKNIATGKEEAAEKLDLTDEESVNEALKNGDMEAARQIQADIDYYEEKEDDQPYNSDKYEDELDHLYKELTE